MVPIRLEDTVQSGQGSLFLLPVEGKALLEPVLAGGLHESLVVLGERHQEDDRSHVLEAVDPLAALRTLRGQEETDRIEF